MGAQFFNPDGTRSAQDTINFSRLMAGIGGALVGGNVNLAAAAGGNAAENNYLSHNPVRGGQLRGFSEDLRRCRATAGCNVDGVYAYWSDISRSQQGAAQTAVAGDFGALGTLTPGLVGALGANPRDFCDSGDTRCYNFITSNNNQAFSVVATANALDGSGPRPQATPATAPATTPAANNSLAGSTVTRGQGGTGPVIGELQPNGTVVVTPSGPQALAGPSATPSGSGAVVTVGGTSLPTPAWPVKNAQPLPSFIQTGDTTCGQACAASMANSLGYPNVTEATLINSVGTGTTSPGQISGGLRTATGGVTQGGTVPFNPATLSDNQLQGVVNNLTGNGSTPVMVLFNAPGTSASNGHWVLVTGVNPSGGIQIRDPVGLTYTMTPQAFGQTWRSGALVTLKKP